MNDKDTISKICNFSYIMAIAGICTLGICPAFGVMSIAVRLVLKKKNFQLGEKEQKKLKTANIISIVSFVLFAIDIVLAYAFLV
ncbi:MAG: hypothetical protein ACI4V4_07365 [Eubacterium sp.]